MQTLSDVILLRSWSNQTQDGDISTCASVAEDSQAWPLVTSTNDNCLGSDCPLYKDCFVVKTRKKAMDADVVVVNHHLFLADMVVKESGFAELIPEAEVMIFDEAHQLPESLVSTLASRSPAASCWTWRKTSPLPTAPN
ncbi:dinG family ATP-dependent helicase YoaA [Klebsiella pneumoniae]|uniref:DinG family ATP-dependent helicase YoaA n=1 Tax=Klebsiella pneumoniae TaxID=573 RepID=A0A4P0YA00_KLEPN|nr:dinG family ATP-dependent helicase YoaA [Klebsiella pneumoniae]